MISKDTIKRTAACYWSTEDDCFVVESPLFDRLSGTGDTEDEAREMFEDMLDDAYSELQSGNVIGYNKVGRPAKEGTQLNCKVRQQTHESVADLAKALDISQGEVVDVLAFHYLNRANDKSVSEALVAAAMRKVLDERGIIAPSAGRSAASHFRVVRRTATTKQASGPKRKIRKDK